MNRPKPISIDRWSARPEGSKLRLIGAVALLVAVALHVALFVLLERYSFFDSFQSDRPAETDSLVVERVVLDEVPELRPEATPQTEPDLADFQEPIAELEDLLPEMANQDIDILTELKTPELSIKMSTPAKTGELTALSSDLALSPSVPSALDTLGAGLQTSLLAAEGQIVLKEGSIRGDVLDSLELLNEASQVGMEGFALDGVMEGYNSIDELMSMSEVNLQGARAALPSDLLFEYNSAELKPEARFGLMKLAMLIDGNPEMYCILEGHTDTHGGDSYNQTLSRARAQSVKDWLMDSMHLGGENIMVRGYGKTRPLVSSGSVEEQAPNRRVDILMRKERPQGKTAPTLPASPDKPRPPAPPVAVPNVTPTPSAQAILVEEQREPQRPKAILVKPRRTPPSYSLPKAILIEEDEVPRAIPLD